jgi:hypothetical protein
MVAAVAGQATVPPRGLRDGRALHRIDRKDPIHVTRHVDDQAIGSKTGRWCRFRPRA